MAALGGALPYEALEELPESIQRSRLGFEQEARLALAPHPVAVERGEPECLFVTERLIEAAPADPEMIDEILHGNCLVTARLEQRNRPVERSVGIEGFGAWHRRGRLRIGTLVPHPGSRRTGADGPVSPPECTFTRLYLPYSRSMLRLYPRPP